MRVDGGRPPGCRDAVRCRRAATQATKLAGIAPTAEAGGRRVTRRIEAKERLLTTPPRAGLPAQQVEQHRVLVGLLADLHCAVNVRRRRRSGTSRRTGLCARSTSSPRHRSSDAHGEQPVRLAADAQRGQRSAADGL